jgi:hypothetical protein
MFGRDDEIFAIRLTLCNTSGVAISFHITVQTDILCSHLSFVCELWAPQGPSAYLFRLESIQRRATKLILQDYESSYVDRLKKLNLILSCWHEIKDIMFFYKCKSGMYELDINQFITSIIPPVPVLVIFFVKICVKRLSSETRTLTELYFYGITCLQISNHPLPSLYLNLSYIYIIRINLTILSM